jgi:hypothetical protein
LLGPDDGSWDIGSINHITFTPCPGLLRYITAIIIQVCQKREEMKGQEETHKVKIWTQVRERSRSDTGSRRDQKGTWERRTETHRGNAAKARRSRSPASKSSTEIPNSWSNLMAISLRLFSHL